MKTIFEVIADPTRRQILDLLLQRPHLVGELVHELKITQPGVSKQLRLLRAVGLVDVRPDGQKRWYVLRAESLQELDQWLAAYRQTWSDRHDRLDDYLRRRQDKEAHNDDP